MEPALPSPPVWVMYAVRSLSSMIGSAMMKWTLSLHRELVLMVLSIRPTRPLHGSAAYEKGPRAGMFRYGGLWRVDVRRLPAAGKRS